MKSALVPSNIVNKTFVSGISVTFLFKTVSFKNTESLTILFGSVSLLLTITLSPLLKIMSIGSFVISKVNGKLSFLNPASSLTLTL